MNFSELYQYIFEDKALPKILEALTEDIKNKKQAAKKEELIHAFDLLMKNESHKENLFILLNQLIDSNDTDIRTKENVTFLKNTLFGEQQTLEIKNSHSVLSNEDVLSGFKKLNDEYQFFDLTNEPINRHYLKLFKACKLAVDFLEANNDQDNSVAFEHAYKLLIIISEKLKHQQKKAKSPVVLAYDYLKQHSKDNRKLVHDALVQSIAINNPKIDDLSGWLRLINTYGYKGLSFFQNAQKITENNENRAPKTIDEAFGITAKLTFHNANENLELALLCNKYNKSQQVFDYCLQVESLRKTQDNLPDVIFDGKEVKCDGYYLVKLPASDLNAYFLGEMTNCCQSIDGDGKQCVIDGISCKNNGFYVLLKSKHNKLSKDPLNHDGSLNYGDFDIVGQSYAWLSEYGNLVFDSWENLRPEVDDGIIEGMLPIFANKIFEKNSSITRVVIGTGGKTPDAIQLRNPYIYHPENMLEGSQFDDSEYQVLIGENREKLNKLKLKSSYFIEKIQSIFSSFNDDSCKQYFSDDTGCFRKYDNTAYLNYLELLCKLIDNHCLYSFNIISDFIRASCETFSFGDDIIKLIANKNINKQFRSFNDFEFFCRHLALVGMNKLFEQLKDEVNFFGKNGIIKNYDTFIYILESLSLDNQSELFKLAKEKEFFFGDNGIIKNFDDFLYIFEDWSLDVQSDLFKLAKEKKFFFGDNGIIKDQDNFMYIYERLNPDDQLAFLHLAKDQKYYDQLPNPNKVDVPLSSNSHTPFYQGQLNQTTCPANRIYE
ncbi:MAG: hypothetical protein EP298_10060 [Gammaproteobacteria bacterium]|nr:MAG: hypothetical protein EP298_10060 [Gammaproteobacteria bacterium]UTW41574.1 hypothetical protein KFE69_08645 [bacterium SCSIO 12844]